MPILLQEGPPNYKKWDLYGVSSIELRRIEKDDRI